MATGIVSWSQTAASNATADSTVNWAEGQAPSSVNDSARAMMASTAKYRDDQAGTLTTGGSSTAYTLTSNQVFASLSAMSGQSLRVKFNATNGAAPTLNVDGLGAKSIVTVTGSAVGTGDIRANTIYDLVYSNSGSEWILSGGPPSIAAFPSGTLMLFQQTSAPTGWTKQSTHNDKALRVVSGTASSGGSTAFSTIMAARTIARANLPNTDFMSDGAGNIPIVIDTGSSGAATTRKLMSSNSSLAGAAAGISIVFDAGAVPSVGGHIYLNGNITQTTMDFAVNYVDLIIAAKD